MRCHAARAPAGGRHEGEASDSESQREERMQQAKLVGPGGGLPHSVEEVHHGSGKRQGGRQKFALVGKPVIHELGPASREPHARRYGCRGGGETAGQTRQRGPRAPRQQREAERDRRQHGHILLGADLEACEDARQPEPAGLAASLPFERGAHAGQEQHSGEQVVNRECRLEAVGGQGAERGCLPARIHLGAAHDAEDQNGNSSEEQQLQRADGDHLSARDAGGQRCQVRRDGAGAVKHVAI